ncbi:glycosyltransferase WbuB [Mycolicibacterium confluentis]|nr:glycosyltransferase WbuB [Mycolicibacterium confluentis]
MELTYGLQLLTSRWGDPDVIVCVTPPLISAGLAALRVRLCVGRPALGMLIHDLYGRGVIEMGVLPGMPSRVIGSVESATLRMADGVAVIHAGFADLLETSGVPRSRIREIRNWTHVLSPDPLASAQFRRAHHWQPDEIVVLHAGNMGHKQGLENVVAAAGFAARNGQRVRFVLLGDGSQRLHLEQAGAGLPTLEFLAPVGEGEFPAALGAADVLLVNERPGVALMAVPSKLTSYFRSGKPIVAATDAAGLTAAELAASGAGIVVPADRPEELVRAALRLGEHRELADQLAAAGQRYCDAMLSEDTAMDRYEAWIMDLAKLRRRGDRSSHER